MKYFKNVKISVTKADIKKGKQLQPSSCPVALALRRATGKALNVGSIAIKTRKHRILTSLPRNVQEFVRKFDSDIAVRPFSFSIQLDKKDLK